MNYKYCHKEEKFNEQPFFIAVKFDGQNLDEIKNIITEDIKSVVLDDKEHGHTECLLIYSKAGRYGYIRAFVRDYISKTGPNNIVPIPEEQFNKCYVQYKETT